ncbi:MAG: hypothetical protein ABFS28_15420 [Bacteroidota bacterium]
MHTEEEKKNKERAQIQSLRSGNQTAILSTLKELRVHGRVSILPELFDLLAEHENEELITEIASLLNDLKDQDAAELFSHAIANPDYKAVQPLLVAACWQNGLSYGKYIATFVEVILSGTYQAAIEAFTVIEEAVGDLEEDQRMQAVKKLKSGIQKVDEQKKSLISELVKVIETY